MQALQFVRARVDVRLTGLGTFFSFCSRPVACIGEGMAGFATGEAHGGKRRAPPE